jgi:glycosyltransferase involved in cell wall biosynthesis
MVKFSLIVPYYADISGQRSEHLNELLETIPDRSDLEILLVDDHSPEPFKPTRDFSRSRLSRVQNEPGCKFAGTARNAGLRLAQGEYVFFADSDDLFHREALDDILDSLMGDAQSDLVVVRSTSFYEDGTDGTRHHYVDRVIDALLSGDNGDALVNYHSPWGKFIRKSFIDKHAITFGPSRVANDVLFAVRLALSQPRHRVADTVVYRVRQGNPSLTSDPSWDAARERIRVACEVHREMERHGRQELRSPLHYQYRKYLAAHPRGVLLEALKAAWARELIVSPPGKMIKTAVKRLRKGLS